MRGPLRNRPAGPAAQLVAGLVLALAGLAVATASDGAPAQLRFEVRLAAGQPEADVVVQVRQRSRVLRELRLDNGDGRLGLARADGELREADGTLVWHPPVRGGALRYRVRIERLRQGRNAAGYDALVTGNWALFRAERAFPVSGWRLAAGGQMEAELVITAPRGWTTVAPYLPERGGRLVIRNPGGRMSRPVGWILTGDIATRRDTIGGMEVAVSAPRGLRMQRIGTLAVLRWALPPLLPHFEGEVPAFVSIVSAGEPMWRGALAAPNSIFVHSDRPLISGNGTSTIVHEMLHVLMVNLPTVREHDWIDEGLAEYLGLWAMRESGTISAARYDETIAHFRRWGSDVKSMRTASAGGAVMARAVAVFHDLDQELRQATSDQQTLFDLIRDLYQADQPADLDLMRSVARARLGRDARALSRERVPGFD